MTMRNVKGYYSLDSRLLRNRKHVSSSLNVYESVVFDCVSNVVFKVSIAA